MAVALKVVKIESAHTTISKEEIQKYFEGRNIAAILIRSSYNTNPDIKKTFELLKLTKKNSLGLFKDNVTTKGMLRKIKDYITFGYVDNSVIDLVLSKKNPIKRDNKGEFYITNIFSMEPPRGGFERKGIKKPYTVGGALGNRKDGMKDLISKMI